MKNIRSLICTILGHIDHGKSSILDKIRGTAIVKAEAGGITQAIGASIIPLSTIKKICGELLKELKTDITIPGLLFIDTPGHAAFTNLRKRGGNLADIAILVIDINEGVKPQTIECIDILKSYKTPFVIAANKIDLLPGWLSKKGKLLDIIKNQSLVVQQLLDKRVYEIVAELSKLNLNSERFDRIQDFTKQIAIIPVSAKTGEGIPELLMILTGLAQRYLESCLRCNLEGPAKGTILEVKEVKGLGKCLDVILYDGTLRKNSTILVGTLTEPIILRVRALFEPIPLKEMRDKRTKFIAVNEVKAATGVRISAPNIKDIIAGMPIISCDHANIEKLKSELKREIEEVIIETDKEGIIVKADTLGSLEALIKLLKEKQIPIKHASIGNITKKDIAEAETNQELLKAILGFNVSSELKETNVKIFTNNIIYKLIEEFERWQEEEKEEIQKREFTSLIKPCKIRIMRGYVFRQSNPAIVGVEVLAGTLHIGTPLMRTDGVEVTKVKSMQLEQENIEKADQGKQVAIAMEDVIIGRQIKEDSILYSSIPEQHFRKLKQLKKFLTEEEKQLIKEIAEIKRKQNPIWGV